MNEIISVLWAKSYRRNNVKKTIKFVIYNNLNIFLKLSMQKKTSGDIISSISCPKQKQEEKISKEKISKEKISKEKSKTSSQLN